MRLDRRTVGGVLWVLAPAVLALTLPSQAVGATPGQAVSVSVSRASLRQGESVEVTVRAAGPVARVRLTFAGRSWPAYAAGRGVWRTILGTDPTTPSGRHLLRAEVTAPGGGRASVRREMTVVRVAFPRRILSFDPDRSALLTPEAVAEERQKVNRALRVLHPTPLWAGPFLRPLQGGVTSGYGVLSIYDGQTRGFHGGVDIPAAEGTVVRAAADGIVRLAEPLPLSGHAVLIDHGLGVVTSYLHLSKIETQAGQRVAKGQAVGRVGSTGLSTGPHLHWGVRVNGVRVDPLPWTRAERP